MHLYTNNLLHVSVSGGVLLRHPTLCDVSPELHGLSDQVSTTDSPQLPLIHQIYHGIAAVL